MLPIRPSTRPSRSSTSVFLLVPLKRSLAELDLAFNSEITDDAFPALAILRKLRFLTLLSTRVEMPGLRTYCTNIRAHGRTMELEVPRECEIYIERKSVIFLRVSP